MGKPWTPEEEAALRDLVTELRAGQPLSEIVRLLDAHLVRWPGRSHGGLYAHLSPTRNTGTPSWQANMEQFRLAVRGVQRRERAETKRARHYAAPTPIDIPPEDPTAAPAADPGPAHDNDPDPDGMGYFNSVFGVVPPLPGDLVAPEVIASFGTGNAPLEPAPAETPAPAVSPAVSPAETEPAPEPPAAVFQPLYRDAHRGRGGFGTAEFADEARELCEAYRRWPGLITPEAFATQVLRMVDRLG